MFILPELIEETRSTTGLIFGMQGYFGLPRTSSSLGRKLDKKISIFEARSAEFKQATTAKRLLFAYHKS